MAYPASAVHIGRDEGQDRLLFGGRSRAAQSPPVRESSTASSTSSFPASRLRVTLRRTTAVGCATAGPYWSTIGPVLLASTLDLLYFGLGSLVHTIENDAFVPTGPAMVKTASPNDPRACQWQLTSLAVSAFLIHNVNRNRL